MMESLLTERDKQMNNKSTLIQELNAATRGSNWIIKTDRTTYEYHFIPRSCNCGGVPETGYGYSSAEEALKAALDRAKVVNTQGYHTHYSKVVKDKKGTK